MFRNLVCVSIWLSFQLAFVSPDKTMYIIDNDTSAKIQHRLELVSNATENLRLSSELNDQRLLRLLTEKLNEINSRLIEISNQINSRLTEFSNQIKRTEISNEMNRTPPISNCRRSIQTKATLPAAKSPPQTKIPNKINRTLPAANSRLSNQINRALPAEHSGNLENKTGMYPTSCLKLAGGQQLIQIDRFSPEPFFVRCDNLTDGGGWIVIQRRFNGFVDFYRDWDEYKRGFGNLAEEFFIGLEKLHALTTTTANELLIVMRDKKNEERFAKHDVFRIGSENEQYAINAVGKYSGNAGDSLTQLLYAPFYTKDRDSPTNCAKVFTTAWWQINDRCLSSLNGRYGDDRNGSGINWYLFHGYAYSMPYVQMMIRPRNHYNLS